MLKQSVAAMRRWLSADRIKGTPQPAPADEVSAVRRSFFKKAALGAASITGTAGLAKVVSDSVPRQNMAGSYARDGVAGQSELKEREYVLMSEQEKRDMVQSFVDGYSRED